MSSTGNDKAEEVLQALIRLCRAFVDFVMLLLCCNAVTVVVIATAVVVVVGGGGVVAVYHFL